MSTSTPVIPFTARRATPAPRRSWFLDALEAWRAHQRLALAIRPRCD